MNAEMPGLGVVTRVDVVVPGMVKEYWADSWTAYIQDEGRTLKLIAKGSGLDHKAERDTALADAIAANIGRIIDSVRRGEAQLASGEPPKMLDEIFDEIEEMESNDD